MFTHNGKVSARQVAIILLIEMVNIGFLVLPAIAATYAGRSGYMLPLLAIPIGFIYLWVIIGLMERFQGATLNEISEQLLGRTLTAFLIILFAVKLTFGAAIELRLFSEVINQVMLPRTPLEIVILVMLLSAGYLSKSGVEAVVRMGEIMAYFIFIPLFLILLSIGLRTDYSQVLPLTETVPVALWEGAGVTSLYFMPLEILLVMVGLMRKPEKAFKAGGTAIVIAGLLESIIVLFTLCTIGIDETKQQMWPVVIAMKTVGAYGATLEKQEVLMLVLWVFTIFMYISTNLCLSSILISRYLNYKRENLWVLPLIVCMFLVAAWPGSLGEMYDTYLGFKYDFALWFLLIIPLLLWVIAKVRRIRHEE